MPADSLQFDQETSRQLLVGYSSPDVAATRIEVLKGLALRAGEHVLDIGSGPGLLLAEMARSVGENGRACGVDASANMNALARDTCGAFPWVELEEADVTSMPFEDASFDAAASTQVYEYVPDVDAALRELSRVLKPGGRAFILDTVFDSITWHTRDPARTKRMLQVFNAHATHQELPFTLSRRLAEAGFMVTHKGILPLFNTELHPNTFAMFYLNVMGSYVSGRDGISEEDVQAFKDEQQALSDAGEFFLSLNRYVFLAVKPPA